MHSCGFGDAQTHMLRTFLLANYRKKKRVLWPTPEGHSAVRLGIQPHNATFMPAFGMV